jgi:hypothetical protein
LQNDFGAGFIAREINLPKSAAMRQLIAAPGRKFG